MESIYTSNDRIQYGIATVLQRALCCSMLESMCKDPEQTHRHFMTTVHQLSTEGYDVAEIKKCFSMAKNIMVHAGDIKYPYPDLDE